MKIFYTYAMLALIAVATLANLYFGFRMSYINTLYSESLVLLLLLVYHLTVDANKNKWLVGIILLFLLSNVIRGIDSYTNNQLSFFPYFMGNLAFLTGVLLIFLNIVKETSFELIYSKFIWLILLIIAVDAYIIYRIVDISIQFGLDTNHLFFGFIFIVLKIILLSVGIIYYLANNNKSRKASFLVITFSFFFLHDITEVIQYLFFMKDPLSGLGLLQSGFSLIGFFFLYLFFTIPKGNIEEWDFNT